MKKLEQFTLAFEEREGFKEKQICTNCGTNLNVGPQMKSFQWAPVWVKYLIISPIIYLIVFSIKVKKAKFEIPQCDECAKKEKKYKTIGLILIFGGILLMFLSLLFANGDNSEFLLIIGMLIFLTSLIWGLVLLIKVAIRIENMDKNGAITFMLKEEVVNKL